jgi:hypothetical protein
MPWHVTNGQIHENLEVLREVTESFNSKFADAGKPLVQLKGICAKQRSLMSPAVLKKGDLLNRAVNSACNKTTKAKQLVSNSNQVSQLRNSMIFLGFKGNARVQSTGHGLLHPSARP